MRISQKLFIGCAMLASQFSAFGQVKIIDEIILPTSIRNKLPFVKQTFYSIKALDSTGMEGYFVFTMDKNRLQTYMDELLYSEIYKELKKFNFLRKTCRPEPRFYICERKYSDLTNFLLTSNFTNNNLFANYSLTKNTQYSLQAKYIKYSHAYKLLEGCVKSKNTYNRELVRTNIQTQTTFNYDEANFSIVMNSSVKAALNILFDECNDIMFSPTPYKKIRTESLQPIQKSLTLPLNELQAEVAELFKVYMSNVKRIRLTEDKNNYYVYCIKSRI